MGPNPTPPPRRRRGATPAPAPAPAPHTLPHTRPVHTAGRRRRRAGPQAGSRRAMHTRVLPSPPSRLHTRPRRPHWLSGKDSPCSRAGYRPAASRQLPAGGRSRTGVASRGRLPAARLPGTPGWAYRPAYRAAAARPKRPAAAVAVTAEGLPDASPFDCESQLWTSGRVPFWYDFSCIRPTRCGA